MAELTQPSGTWVFDGETIRIVPSHGKGVHPLRAALGELVVPLQAVAGAFFEAGKKGGGRLRLRLREGSDPLTQATGGRLPQAADPYVLEVEKDRSGAAEYLADAVRDALVIEQVPEGASERYLLPGPSVPITLNASDGRVVFDGERLTLTWGWGAEESKKSTGVRTLALAELTGAEWSPPRWESGYVRFRLKGAQAVLKPSHDPNCVVMWGWREARETAESALLVAALTARLPHPRAAVTAGAASVPEQEREPEAADHDTILRRLRELGELHRAGVLTDEEFAVAKKAVLDRL